MIETPGRILDRHLTEPLEQSNRTTSANGRVGPRNRICGAVYRGTPAAGVRLEELLTDVGLSQGETHVLALLADGAVHTVGELQHDLAPPVQLSGIPDRLESRGLIRRALNIPQPSLCLDVACEDVCVGLR